LLGEDNGQPVILDTYNPTVRYGMEATFAAAAPGEHSLVLFIPAIRTHTARGRR